MVGGWRFGVQPECGQYLTGQTPAQKHVTWRQAVPIQRRPWSTAACHVCAYLHVSGCAVTAVFCNAMMRQLLEAFSTTQVMTPRPGGSS